MRHPLGLSHNQTKEMKTKGKPKYPLLRAPTLTSPTLAVLRNLNITFVYLSPNCWAPIAVLPGLAIVCLARYLISS